MLTDSLVPSGQEVLVLQNIKFRKRMISTILFNVTILCVGILQKV